MADETSNPDPNATATEAKPIDAPPPIPPAPQAPADVPVDVLTQIMVDYLNNGQYVMETVERGASHQRDLVVGGTHVEHVGEDTDGRWCFRAM